MTGPIPPELDGLGQLEELVLQSNSLTGPIPAALGRPSNLRTLLLGFNLLSGRIPAELGSLTGLEHLEVGDTMLSGPLPESLTRLSTLDWLRLEGSGLCVPDAPAFEAWVAAIRDFTGAVCTAESPLVYGNAGSGRFRAMSLVPFTGSGRVFGLSPVPADVNGDTAIDFVVPHGTSGPDRRHGTADDFTILVTLLNTTPVGPLRCGSGAPSNPPPTTVGTLSDRALAIDGTLTVDVSQGFVDRDGDALTFTASSSAPRVVMASVNGARVTLVGARARGRFG